MNLPQTTELDELNRILIAVAELSVQNQGCSVASVIALCSSFALAGRPADHRKTLRQCSYAGLLTVTKGLVALTDTGNMFLNLNPTNSYELTDKQRQFVAKHLILSGPWRSRARDLLLNFSPNYSKVTYELDVLNNPLPSRFGSTVHLLQKLGVLLRTDNILVVVPEYVSFVRGLRSDRQRTTEEDLAVALEADQKLGAQAEEAVVDYERSRLKALGRAAEASLVRRISQLDVGAGYDVESYDGDKPLFDYDRFIEVKASEQSKLRFYWSANECQVAEKMGNQYWIYFVGNYRSNQTSPIRPIMIQDPANRLSQIPQLRVEASKYLVTQHGELTFSRIDQQDIEGFLL